MGHFRVPFPSKGPGIGQSARKEKEEATPNPGQQYSGTQSSNVTNYIPASHFGSAADYGYTNQGVPVQAENIRDPSANGYTVGGDSENKGPSFQIVHRFANKKVVDFTSRLVRPDDEDFAAVHSSGEGNYPSNLACTICDYSKGKGEKSVSVTYTIPAIHIEKLFQAASAAQLHLLHQPIDMPDCCAEADALYVAAGNILTYLRQCLKIKAVPSWDDLISSGQQLSAAIHRYSEARRVQEEFKKTVQPCFQYKKEKNNPYNRFAGPNGMPHVHVMTIDITYVPAPARRLPWCIRIANFDAPFVEKGNTISHISRKADNRRECSIFLSEENFWEAMRLAHSHIQLWEMGAVQQFKRKYAERENIKKENTK